MDVITEHHYHNIANGKAHENKDGTLSTVKTLIVEIDGVETLIPTVWDGEIVDDQTAIRFANDSGIDWPTRTGKDVVRRLENFDEAIHRQFNDQTSPEEAPKGSSGIVSTSLRPKSRPEELVSTGSGTTMLMDSEGNFYDEDGVPYEPENNEYASTNEFALGGLATARKGIKTQEGLNMANNKFQLDRKKADTDGNGKLSKYEEVKGEAVQKAMDNDEIPEMYHGGMACSCGYGEDCGCGIMSEEMPIGALEAEVADNISVMISEGEYVLPANVVKWHGLKHIMSMQDEAEMGLMMMHETGLIKEVSGETQEESDSEGSENAEVSDESDTKQEETELEETDEYLASDYGKMSDYGMMKKQRFTFIV